LAAILTLPQRHQHRAQHQVAILEGIHRPADDLLAEEVEHHAQVQPAFAGADVGDVGDPLGVRLVRCEVSLQVVPDVAGSSANTFVPPAPPLRQAVQFCGGHQPGHPVGTGTFALEGQSFVHPRHPDHTIALGMDLANALQQTCIVACTRTRRAPRPLVITAARHLQTPAHQPERVLIAVAPDRRVPHGDSLAKNAAASRKKSRSFFTRASSRRSVASSSSRGTPAPVNVLPGFASSRRQRLRTLALTPSSWATWLTDACGRRVRSTASRLNSALNFLRCAMTLLSAHDELTWKCPWNRGRTHLTTTPWRRTPPHRAKNRVPSSRAPAHAAASPVPHHGERLGNPPGK